MNAEYIEHAIRHCRANDLNNIAEQAAAELARLRAIEAAARIVLESGIVFWLDGYEGGAITRCAGCDFVWGEGHHQDCKVGKLAAALNESESQ